MASISSSLLHSFLVLLVTRPWSLYAQPQQSPAFTPSSSASPAPFNDPAGGDSAPVSFTSSALSSAIPSATDSAGYGNNDDTSVSSHNGILNYYFLLLAIFVIAMLTIYWSLARRRRRAAAQLIQMQRSVLSEDVRSWTRHQRAGYGFEDEERPRPRVEEGLDEAGEAPPAYVKEPERVHLERPEGVELRGMARLREMVGLQGKPPAYEERVPPR